MELFFERDVLEFKTFFGCNVMKLCLLLAGQMRTYRDPAIMDSYRQYLPGDVDVYIFTWKNIGLNSHQNDIEEKDLRDHYAFFNVKKIIVEDFDAFYDALSPSMKSLYDTPFRDHSNKTTSVPIQYKYQQAIRHMELGYTHVIMTRPDMAIQRPIPIGSEDNTVYFQCASNRCIDHGWFGTPATLLRQLGDIFDQYETNVHTQNRDNNELLLHQCIVQGIRVKHLGFDTLFLQIFDTKF